MLQRSGNKNGYSPEFMNLINCMLQTDPIHRPSIYEVVAHDWFKGEVPTQDEVIKEFQQRHNLVRQELEAQKQEKIEQKQKTYEIYKDEQFIPNANPEKNGDLELFKPKKNLDDYVAVFNQNTEFFSSYNPDMIEQKLLKSLKDEGITDMKVSQDKYKVKF